MMMPFTPIMGGFGWLGLGFMILFWALIIWGIVYIINKAGSPGDAREPRDKALEILKERYAKGEIDKKEFMEKKQALAG